MLAPLVSFLKRQLLVGSLMVAVVFGIFFSQLNSIPLVGAADLSNLDLSIGSPDLSPLSGANNTSITVAVYNAGPSDATNVAVELVVPTGMYLTHGTAEPSQGTYDPDTDIWTVGTIVSGTSRSILVPLSALTTNANDQIHVITAEILSSDQDDPGCVDGSDIASPINCYGDGINQGNDLASISVRPYIRSNLSLYWNTVSDSNPVNGQETIVKFRLRNEGPTAATGVKVNLNFVQQQLVEGVWGADSGNFTLDTGSIVSHLCEYYTGTCGGTYGTYDTDTGEWDVGNLLVFTGGTNWQEAELYLEFTKTTTNANDRRVVLTGEIMEGDQADPSCGGGLHSTTNCFGDGIDQGADLITVTIQPYIRSNLSLYWNTVSDSNPLNGQETVVKFRLRNEGPTAATGVKVNLQFVQQQLVEGVWAASSGNFTLDNGSIVSHLCEYYTPTCGSAYGTYDPDTGEWDVGNLLVFTGGTNWQEAELYLEFTKTTTNANDRRVVLTGEIMEGDQADPSCGGGLHSTTNCFGDGIDQGADLITATIQPYIRSDLVLNWNTISDSNPLNGQETVVKFRLRNYGPIAATGVKVNLQFVQQQLVEGVWGADSGHFTLDTGSIVSHMCELYTTTCGPAYGTYDPDTGEWDIGNVAVFEGGTNWQEAELYLEFTKTTTNVNDRRVVLTGEIMEGDQADPSCGGGLHSTTNCFGDGISHGDDLISLTIQPYIRSDLILYWNTISDSNPVNGQETVVRFRLRNYGPVVATGVKVNLQFVQQQLVEGVWGADSGHFTLDTGSIMSHMCEYYTPTCGTAYGTYDPDTGEWDIGNVAIFEGGTNWQEAELYLEFTKTTTNVNDRRVVLTGEIMEGDQADPSCGGGLHSTTNCFGDGVNHGDDLISLTIQPYIRSDLYLGLVFSTSTPAAGSSMTHTVTLYNNGPSTASGVEISYPLPAGLVYISDNQGTYDPDTGIWQVSSQSPASNRSLVLTVVPLRTTLFSMIAEIVAADQADPSCGGGLHSTTNCFGNGSDQGGDFLSGGFTPFIDPLSADLRLDLAEDNASPDIGTNVVYTLTITNEGPSTATSVEVAVNLPVGMSYISDDSGGAYDSDTDVWTVGSLISSEVRILNVTIGVQTPGTKVVSAQVSASDQIDGDSIVDDNSVDQDDDVTSVINGQAINLGLVASIDPITAHQGDTVELTVTLTNYGPSTATGIETVFDIPSQLTYVSASGAGVFDPDTDIWSIGSLSADNDSTVVIVFTPNGLGELEFPIEISSADQPDTDAVFGNNSTTEDDDAVVALSVIPYMSDLSLEAELQDGAMLMGQSSSYTLTLLNSGPDNAPNIAVSIDWPSELEYTSDNSGGAYSSTTGIWELTSLANEDAVSLTVYFTAAAQGNFDISAEIVSAGANDIDSIRDNHSTTEDDDALVTQVVSAGIGSIIGHVFTDTNANSMQDAGESNGFATADVLITNGSLSYHPAINSSGNFTQAVGPGSYTVVVTGGQGTLVRPSNGSINVVVVGGDEVNSGNFGISGTYTGNTSGGGSSGSSSGVSSGGGSSSFGGSTGWSRSSSSNSSSSSRSSSRSSTRSSRTQETTTVPTPSASPLPQPPLQCLSIGSVPPLTFSDVAGENTDLNFLTSTVFIGTDNLRVMQGSNGLFMGERYLTRFELTKLILAASCINYSTSTPIANQYFEDVSNDNSEFSQVIGHAFVSNIIAGVGNHFYPQNNVTYGELFKILFKAAALQGYRLPPTVLNQSIQGITDESFRPYAEQAVSMGLITLNQNNEFPQNQPVTRNEMVRILARYFRILTGILQ